MFTTWYSVYLQKPLCTPAYLWLFAGCEYYRHQAVQPKSPLRLSCFPEAQPQSTHQTSTSCGRCRKCRGMHFACDMGAKSLVVNRGAFLTVSHHYAREIGADLPSLYLSDTLNCSANNRLLIYFPFFDDIHFLT